MSHTVHTTYKHYGLLKRFRLCRRPDIALVSAGGAGQLLGKQQRDSQWNIKINQKVHDSQSPTRYTCILVFVALWAHKCYGLKHDTAMLKAALTSCNLSGPLAARDICVTLHIPTVSRDKVPPAPHEAVTDVAMLKKE